MGSAGPVSNVPLWKELLQHPDSTFQDILWVKGPSHVNVEGNEQADTLANNGRLSNPLYPTRKTPKVHPARQRVKRTCQVAAQRSPSREVSPPRPTVLNFEQCTNLQGPRPPRQRERQPSAGAGTEAHRPLVVKGIFPKPFYNLRSFVWPSVTPCLTLGRRRTLGVVGSTLVPNPPGGSSNPGDDMDPPNGPFPNRSLLRLLGKVFSI